MISAKTKVTQCYTARVVVLWEKLDEFLFLVNFDGKYFISYLATGM